jgi:hypothetical protein
MSNSAGQSEFHRVEQDLMEYLERLASEYNRLHDHKVGVASIAKLLGSNACERRISFELRNNSEQTTRFDSFYREKSEYATLKILDHLKRRLVDKGYEAAIATEVKDDVGIYDVTIVQGTPCEILRRDELLVRLEIKASLGLPLEQIERYLWRPSPLILVRVPLGQVSTLRPSDLEEFVRFSQASMLAKASRLLEGQSYVVPGRYCRSCLDLACKFNTRGQDGNRMMVSMSDTEFDLDLHVFMRNLPFVSERTAELVIDMLKESGMPLASSK